MKKFLFLSAAVLAVSGAANAAPINQEVPANAYISLNGFDWAWANPLPGGVDLSFQGGFGWRLPTVAELALSPFATDFIFDGANVPIGAADPVTGATFHAVNAGLTGDAACATAYFSVNFSHCDWQDGLGQPLGPWAGMAGAENFAEQLVLRDVVNAVPAPGVLGLLGLGVLGLALRRRA